METNGSNGRDGLDITTRTTNTNGRHNHPRKKRRESRRESRFADPNESDSDPPDRIFATVASSARSLDTIESVRSIINFTANENDAESSNGQDQHKDIERGADDNDNDADPRRMVVVRYFLDRPGYGFHNSAARFWFDPPEVCMSRHVHAFLKEQGIALDGLLIEIHLDKFQAFMLLEACEANLIQWNFGGTNIHDPGVLNVRLTDLARAEMDEKGLSGSGHSSSSNLGGGGGSSPHPPIVMANTIPAGLLSFAMMVGLETAALMGQMFPGTVSASFTLAWGPYMLFVGGLLQIIVGTLQVFRNNIYGAIAFLGFGSFWLANGTVVTLQTFLASDGTVAVDDLAGMADPVGGFIRTMYIFAFSCVLLKQTLVMNKLSTTLISLLCSKLAFQALAQWFDAARYGQLASGWLTSLFAFYVFTTELTNAVYHREVFPVYKWSDKTSPEEVFGAQGRGGTLFSKAARHGCVGPASPTATWSVPPSRAAAARARASMLSSLIRARRTTRLNHLEESS